MTTQYANFNTVTFTGRICEAKLVKSIKQEGEFLSVTVLSTLKADGQVATIQFTDNSLLKSLFTAYKLPIGKEITVTGHISEVTNVYKDKEGEVRLLKNPRITLTYVSIAPGALGRDPLNSKKGMTVTPGQVVKQRKETDKVAPVDPTPNLEPVEDFDFAN